MKRCPLCAEEIQDEAIKCRHCLALLVPDFVAARLLPVVPPLEPQTSGMAIASMVLGILWLYWIGSILALIFGYLAYGEIKREGGRLGGRSFAKVGIVLGWVGIGTLVVLVIVVVVIAVLSPDTFKDIPERSVW